MKNICAITMVRKDNFFLRKWIEYYGKELGKENLYVYLDGTDNEVPDFCEGVNITLCEKVKAPNTVKFDKRRIIFLSKMARELFKRYDIVIGTDGDEFLLVDPNCGVTLAQYLSSLKNPTSVSGLGVDVGQHLDHEGVIDLDAPLLGQRQYGFLSSRYTKPNTIFRPVMWGSGYHRVKGLNFHIDKNLFLFHFGSMDYKILDDRRIHSGFSERHLRKRARTILTITKNKVRDWDKTTRFARILQTIFRPLYAPNKPSTLWFNLIVKIPKRFHNII